MLMIRNSISISYTMISMTRYRLDSSVTLIYGIDQSIGCRQPQASLGTSISGERHPKQRAAFSSKASTSAH